ncbi:hypothetical protein HS088_TW15G01122 [Tripterygium wilfordii]|uniref:Protein LTV1 n=1 Tax=Tripterygium wilfordii TaxID=458696 RepID=A0A7J7CNF1_TRIWF|nr:protein LTV1 homolog [Tripterygium wilfordii]XP_038725935.1 protein LTV1 homolog [Tripterygium wilfordii]KAF5735613.1 hypothetical protein HS088_TW15G01122 [Tripterygium wilfordii]
MGKKKFFDKKKSATFQLLARDSSDPYYDNTPGSDRVFVRVDNNPYSADTFDESMENLSGEENPDSKFADAPDDASDDEGGHAFASSLPSKGSIGVEAVGKAAPLPEHIRREILELGFPDDGYNYLTHLREIKNTGGGSMFYNNPKPKLDQLPGDVRAYDASRVLVSEARDDSVEQSIYSVASKTVGVRVKKAIDPDVAALLDDSDLSRFGSDVEDLEEDFVIHANLTEGGLGIVDDNKLDLVGKSRMDEVINESSASGHPQNALHSVSDDEVRNRVVETAHDCAGKEARARRVLDEQFDLLEHQEYGLDDEDDNGYGNYIDEDESLADKLKHALNKHKIDDLELEEGYKAPADILRGNQSPKGKKMLDSAAVLSRCVEYAEKYQNGDEDEQMELVEESSDESEQWDCESIVSTYSNLDNHPGKIEAPEMARKKKLAQTISGTLSSSNHVISLRGKEKLPVEFLPQTRKHGTEKVKGTGNLKAEVHRRERAQESKDEKKERKAAVKEERREARRTKKEMKGLYHCEAQRAQRVAAFSGPSSIHLM